MQVYKEAVKLTEACSGRGYKGKSGNGARKDQLTVQGLCKIALLLYKNKQGLCIWSITTHEGLRGLRLYVKPAMG